MIAAPPVVVVVVEPAEDDDFESPDCDAAVVVAAVVDEAELDVVAVQELTAEEPHTYELAHAVTPALFPA